MQALFDALTRAVEGAPAFALAAAFGWGVLSLLLSPCHLAAAPLVVGFVLSKEEGGVPRAVKIALAFALGILVSIAAVGGVTAGLRRMAGDAGAWAEYAVAAVLLYVGLHLIGAAPLPWSGGGLRGSAGGGGARAAFTVGLLFGVAVGPCTFAYMAPVLGAVFHVAARSVIYAGFLVLAYGLGHCTVIVLAGRGRIGFSGIFVGTKNPEPWPVCARRAASWL